MVYLIYLLLKFTVPI